MHGDHHRGATTQTGGETSVMPGAMTEIGNKEKRTKVRTSNDGAPTAANVAATTTAAAEIGAEENDWGKIENMDQGFLLMNLSENTSSSGNAGDGGGVGGKSGHALHCILDCAHSCGRYSTVSGYSPVSAAGDDDDGPSVKGTIHAGEQKGHFR